MTSVDLRWPTANAFRILWSALVSALAFSMGASVQGSEYSDLVQSHGPVAYWRLGESSGTTATDTTGAHNGAYQNAVTLGGTGAITGDSDTAATFGGGANDRAQVNAFGVAGSGITILAWYKANGFGDDRFVAKATGTGVATSHWALGTGSSTQLKAQIKISGTTQELLPTVSTMATGVWYFIAMTYDGSTMRVYLDGVQVGSAAYAGAVSTDATVAVGLGNLPSGAGNRAFNGTLDESAIFDKALSAAQISALYSAAGGGLRGHWKLIETSGTVAADSSIQTTNGAYTNGVVLASSGPYPGAGDKAANFDGVNDYVAIPNEARYDLTGPMSVAAWIKVDVFDDTEQAIVTKGDTAWRLQRDGSNYGVNFRCQGLSTTTVASTVNVNGGKWRHVVGVYTGSQLQIYVDGVLNNSVSSSGTISTNNNAVSIGRNIVNPGRQFDGSIHDVRIYNRSLSAVEVANLYGLLGHWKFAEGAGTTAADASGLSNNASLNAGAAWSSDCAGNNALLTNGAGGVAQTASSFDPPNEGMVAFWMRPAASSALRRIFGLGGDWEVRLQPDGTLISDLSGDGSTVIGTSTPLNDAGRWYHVAVYYNCSDDAYAIYVDGVLDNSGTNSVGLVKQTAALLSFGTRTGSTEYWPGELRDFRVYNRRLYDADIADLAGFAAHWKLDESSGTIADSTACGRTGTVSGTATWTAGKVNNGLQLNGSTYVTVPGLLNAPRNIGCAAWVNLTTADSSGADVISLGNYFAIRLNEAGTSRAMFYNGTSWVSATVNQSYGPGWRHFAAVFDDDNNVLKFYVNGVQVASTSTTSSISYAGQGLSTLLGRHGNGSTAYDFTGVLDDVRVYSRAICQSQIDDIITQGGGLYQGVRVLQWVETR